MGPEMQAALETVFGTDGDPLGVLQMAARAIVVYPLALAIVRLGDKRLIGTSSAFDFLLAIVIGSVVSRAITGNAPFLPCIVTGWALVALHWLFAKVAFHVDGFARLVKGEPRVLVRDGEIQWDAMRRSSIGLEDLRSGMRRNGNLESVEDVARAVLERNGDISVIRRARAAAG